MAERRQSIVIDCDPGQDDALAILMALGAPAIEVVAITAVAGNVPLARTAANALRVADLAGRPDIPVHAGCARPLQRAPVTAEHVHGTTGLDGADLPPPRRQLQDEDGVDALVRILRQRPEGTVTLCPMGPLTNLALAFLKAPDVVPRVETIVLMGGSAGEGNITASAEFNIFADPHAAKTVFEAGAPLVMHGLDVTRQAVVTPARLEAIRALGTRPAIAAADLLAFYGSGHPEGVALLHDPCVIAWLLRPDLFASAPAHVAVETQGEHTVGRTVVDFHPERRRHTPGPANATVVTGLDADGFFDLLGETIARLG